MNRRGSWRRWAVLSAAAGAMTLLTFVSSAAPVASARLVQTPQGQRSSAAASARIVIRARDGRAGRDAGHGQGSDQGEDQGENIDQFASGPARIGPTTVIAPNSLTSGDAVGGKGGSVTVTVNNHVSTLCGQASSVAMASPESLVIRSGNGGRGGSTGRGQGADQGEDQGENIGQYAKGSIGPTVVVAVNRIVSGHARGGNGGDVNVTFNTYTTCATTSGHSQLLQPSLTLRRDTAGNVFAIYTRYTNCASGPGQAFVIEAGDGGAAGSTGRDQGADQGEDQGENIGQYSSGSRRGGPTTVKGVNSLVSADADGGDGGNVTVTLDHYIDLTCASGANQILLPVPTAPLAITAGSGGRGGSSGAGQGSDQGEDQGENVGQFASGHGAFGATTIRASNSIVAGDAGGGSGGNVSVVYNDYGTCASGSSPATTVDERVAGRAGSGGVAGSSGTGQGSDQGEDQGENVGQFASGHAAFGQTTISAVNSNVADDARGGDGGSVRVTYHSGTCSSPVGSSNERVTGTAGNGGRGGSSGKDQGADQGEDQGENVGQHSSQFARFGRTTITAVNLNLSGDAGGGNGGDVSVFSGSATCSTPAPASDPRVAGTVGSGGAAGSSGSGQGSDQGEDQGENVGLRARGTHGGNSTVSATSKNKAGPARGGKPGVEAAFDCSTAAISLREAPVRTAPADPPRFLQARSLDPDIKACKGVLKGRWIDVLVRSGAVCTLAPGARIRHNVEVEPGGVIIDQGAVIGHDLTAYRPSGFSVVGGSVGHDLVINRPGGTAVRGGNRVCGADVSHNLVVQDGTSGAGVVVVGGIDSCAGNVVDHDLVVQSNAGGAAVCRNTGAHDADCRFNGSLTGGANRAAHANSCAAS